MSDNFQSGKTQAIDLDELHVASQNRPVEMRVRGEFELDKWGDDPWASTEDSRRRRKWAEDDRWSGDDEEKKERPEDAWQVDEEAMKAGWHAPKRGDQLVTDDEWGDWDNFGGAPKQLDIEQESKDFGVIVACKRRRSMRKPTRAITPMVMRNAVICISRKRHLEHRACESDAAIRMRMRIWRRNHRCRCQS